MSTETTDVPTEPHDVTTQQDETTEGTTSDPASAAEWHASVVGFGIVGFDVALMLGIAASTTRVGDHLVPWEVYAFGALGALGYVFRSLLHGFDQSVTDVLRTNVQVLAAIPLAAGIFLFADLANSGDPGLEFIAAISFVAGLYVDLAYETLSNIADRVLSKGLGGGRSGSDSTPRQRGGPGSTAVAGAGEDAGSDSSPRSGDDGGTGSEK